MLDEPTIIESTTPPPSNHVRRYYWLYFLLVGITVLLVGRSFYLQIIRGHEFRTEAEQNRVLALPIAAPRGIIYDRYGTQLVENIATTDLVLDPALLPTKENEEYLLDQLPKIVPGLTTDTIRQALRYTRQEQRVTTLAKSLDHDTVLRLEEVGELIHGARLTSSLVRRYPLAEVTAHLLGYTSAVTAPELNTRSELLPTDTTGKTGIEMTYDSSLRGRHGLAYTEVNAAGRPQKDLGTQSPVPGEDVHLTIDVQLQQRIFDLWKEYARTQADRGRSAAGATIALDPRSGEIRALVSYPAYDPNTFSLPTRQSDLADITRDPAQPLFNRVTDGTYPPGSVIKPFLATAGLEEGVITETTTVLSTGGISIGPWRFPDWKAGGHGVTDVRKAIAESVNTFFYLLAGGDDTRTGLGVDTATYYLQLFGWGAPTGVDLPTEAAGFLPSPEWKEATKHEPWYIGDTYHLAIGQGDVLVTPLQVAAATAAVANGQFWYQPHLVVGKDQRRQLAIDAKNIQIAREGMRQAVTSGSGLRLATLDTPIAGKTGTAQIGGSEDTHAWFTSFAPYDDPQLVVTVLLERGGEGDKVAVPFAQQIWQWWIDNRLRSQSQLSAQ